MKKHKEEKTTSRFKLDMIPNDDQISFYLAGKAVMSELLSEDLESVEIFEINEKIIRLQKSAAGYFVGKQINNAADFPDFSMFSPSEMRLKIERSFLIVAAGVWAKSIFLFDKGIETKRLNFDRIQMLAVEASANTLFALRSALSRPQLKFIDSDLNLIEESFLDYEAFLYRQSFAIVSHKIIWQSIVEVAALLKAKRILSEKEILEICDKNKKFIQMRQEITQFYFSR